MPKKTIDKDAVLSDILEKKGAAEVLVKFQVPCLHCHMAQMEMGFLKIGDVCKTYGIDEKKLLKDLNKLK